MKISRNVTVDTSAEKVWEIVGTNFSSVDTWAARMLTSAGDDALGELGGRQVETVEYGPTTETLYLFDNDSRQLGYTVAGDGMPPIVSDVTTEWHVEPNGDDQAVVTMLFTATLADPDMTDMLSGIWHQGAEPLLDELKHYAETGEPHLNNAVAATATNTKES